MNALNYNLNFYNTFYWDKQAYALSPGDYTKAVMTHWMPTATGISGLIHSRKKPLENRVWFNYPPGPANPTATVVTADTLSMPTAIGRVLDNGSTQLSRFSYNLIGKPTASIDPLGRQTNFFYAPNLIDLVETTQKNGASNDILFKATYNVQHLPLTTTDAAGEVTTSTYNAAGQPLTITNAKHETTTMVYNANGYLQTVTGAIPGSTTSFTYDNAGRIATVTDSENYTVANS